MVEISYQKEKLNLSLKKLRKKLPALYNNDIWTKIKFHRIKPLPDKNFKTVVYALDPDGKYTKVPSFIGNLNILLKNKPGTRWPKILK